MRKFFLPKPKISGSLPRKQFSLQPRVKPTAPATSVMHRQPPWKPFQSLFKPRCRPHHRTTTASDKSLLAPVFKTSTQPTKLTSTTKLQSKTTQLNEQLSFPPTSLTRQKSRTSLTNRTWPWRKLGTASPKTFTICSKPAVAQLRLSCLFLCSVH
jgi:hypothetical protein